jgi:release factor glutamine methyltransferase
VEAALEILKEKRAMSNEQGTRNKEQGANPLRALDLCTGSGAVAIALKNEMPELEVWAADISPESLAVARLNWANLLPGKEVFFVESDLFNSLQDRHFDLIVSNPPYIASGELKHLAPEIQKEPPLALDGGKDGLDLIRRIVKEAPNKLLPNGALLMEADPRQMNTIATLLKDSGFTKCRTFKDLSGNLRVIGGRKNNEQ